MAIKNIGWILYLDHKIRRTSVSKVGVFVVIGKCSYAEKLMKIKITQQNQHYFSQYLLISEQFELLTFTGIIRFGSNAATMGIVDDWG